MALYIVTVTDKFPAAGECPGSFEIEADNKKEAIAKARKQMGWRSRYDSPMVYSAERA